MSLNDDIQRELFAAIERGQFILGPNVQAFEKEVADYLGVKHAIGCANGSDALYLALEGAQIEAGDEVITTPFTFFATIQAIRRVGAIPIFADIHPRTFNIDPVGIEQQITSRTKAILPVHIFGQPADMPRIINICEKYNLKLIEDCAQSFGARIGNKQTGSFGDTAAFSFYPTKNLGCFGDGGLVATQSNAAAEKIRKLANHGSSHRHHHEMFGINSRLDELQAIVLRAKLKHIDHAIEQHRFAAHRYTELLRDTPFILPLEDCIGLHTYHQYTVLCEHRHKFEEAFKKERINYAIHYPTPVYKQPAFKNAYDSLFLSVTEQVTASCLSLPTNDAERVAKTIRRVLSH